MTIYEKIIRLFFSRHSLLLYASVFFLAHGEIQGDQFVWLMGLYIGSSSAEKFKDNVKIGKTD